MNLSAIAWVACTRSVWFSRLHTVSVPVALVIASVVGTGTAARAGTASTRARELRPAIQRRRCTYLSIHAPRTRLRRIDARFRVATWYMTDIATRDLYLIARHKCVTFRPNATSLCRAVHNAIMGGMSVVPQIVQFTSPRQVEVVDQPST